MYRKHEGIASSQENTMNTGNGLLKITSKQMTRVSGTPNWNREKAVRTSHIQNASNLFLGGGSSSLECSIRHQKKERKQKKNVRHCVKFGYVSDKVHLAWAHRAYTHDEPCADVKHREQHNWQIVSHKGGRRPVSLEEDLPSAKLLGCTSAASQRKSGVVLRTKSVTVVPITQYHAAKG